MSVGSHPPSYVRWIASTSAGAGLWTWQEPGTGAGSIRHALDYLLLFATNESKPWPWTQKGEKHWEDFPWNGLKVQMRVASIVYGDEVRCE
jgi:hypothetical protein